MREISYNKKETFKYACLNVYLLVDRHLISYEIRCHFFMAITKKVSRNKMIEMFFKTF